MLLLLLLLLLLIELLRREADVRDAGGGRHLLHRVLTIPQGLTIFPPVRLKFAHASVVSTLLGQYGGSRTQLNPIYALEKEGLTALI